MTSSQPADKHTLVVDLLGSPHVSWNRQPLEMRRRQPRALLYYLAVHLHPVSRGHLSYLLWADEGEMQARRKLSHLLNELRRSLPAPDLLTNSGDQLGLDAARVHSDARTFLHRYRDGTAHASPAALQQVVALYRGDFLAGFDLPHRPEYDLWLAHERRTWQRRYLDALRCLIDYQTATAQYAAAIEHLQQYLHTDPLAEEMHARLIRLYALTGQRSAALRQYEDCIVTLERELGVDPTPDTRAAYEEALHGDVTSPPASTLAPAHPIEIRHPLPLVDRGQVLHTLYEAHAQAQAGTGRFVLLAGEPGSGKSRLLDKFTAGLPAGTPVLLGRGGSVLRETPYGLLVKALREGLAAYGLPPLDPAWLAVLAQILPELGEGVALAEPVAFDQSVGQTRLLEALDQLLLAWRRDGQAVVLCLDDLHWADEATYTWLAYLKRRLASAPVLVVGAYRTGAEQVGSAPGLPQLRHALVRSGVLTELHLAGLDRAATRQLVANVLRDGCGAHAMRSVEASEPLTARLQRWTGGNPLLLVELLHSLRRNGWQPDQALSLVEVDLSQPLQEAVAERLHFLDGLSRQVLEAAAVLGEVFTFAQVQQVSGRSDLETIDALDTLVAHQLLIEEPDCYRFRHALVQQAIYRRLSHHRRRLLAGRRGD